MAFRQKDDVHLTVAMPLVDRFIEYEGDYFKTEI